VKILFTFLAISTGVESYLKSSKKLITEILKNTQHDVLLTTNKVEYYSDINDSRLIVRNNVPNDSVFMYRGGVEFNYRDGSEIDTTFSFAYSQFIANLVENVDNL
jgi:hypothetical protein